MASKHQGLLNRDGRYFSRLVIPKELRPFLNDKTELREALGPDRRAAIAAHHGAMARLQAQIAIAERKASIAGGRAIEPGRHPLPVDQIALRNYNDRIAFDTELRDAGHLWAAVGVDDRMIALLRDGIAGKLTDDVMETLIGDRIERYRRLGNTTVVKGSDEWRTLARAMCVSELDATARVMERDEGDFTGKPEHPMLANAVPVDQTTDITEAEFNGLTFEDIITEQERITAMGLGGNEKSPATLKKYRGIVHDFEHFRRSKKVATVTLADAEAWRNSMLANSTHSRKTIRDKLAAIRAILTWGQKQSRGKLFPDGDPLKFLEMPVAESKDSADRTYSLEQARKVLIAARAQTKPTFRWMPWLLAHSGMRISEALQLEKADFLEVEGRWFMHIRVGEGRTTKTRKSRKVPVHQALIVEGFLNYVRGATAGPIFPGVFQDQRLREWILEEALKGEKDTPAPNHGFRHLFEDALFGEVNHKAALYITGRSSGTSADDYGGSDWKLLELARQMDKVKRIL